jgi:hypothetical protein
VSGTFTQPFVGASWNAADALTQLPPAMLQTMLNDAVMARHSLMIGTKEMVVTYGNGDGNRSVTFTRATLPNLNAYIEQLEIALGMRRGRARAIMVRP